MLHLTMQENPIAEAPSFPHSWSVVLLLKLWLYRHESWGLDSCTSLAMSECFLERINKNHTNWFHENDSTSWRWCRRVSICMIKKSTMDVPIVQPHDFFPEVSSLCPSCAMLLRLASVVSGIDKFSLQSNLFNHASGLLSSHCSHIFSTEKNKGKIPSASLGLASKTQAASFRFDYYQVNSEVSTLPEEFFCAATWFYPQVAKFHWPWPSRMPRRCCLMHHQICNYPSIWNGLLKHANQDAIYLHLPQVLHLCSLPPRVLTRAAQYFRWYIM